MIEYSLDKRNLSGYICRYDTFFQTQGSGGLLSLRLKEGHTAGARDEAWPHTRQAGRIQKAHGHEPSRLRFSRPAGRIGWILCRQCKRQLESDFHI